MQNDDRTLILPGGSEEPGSAARTISFEAALDVLSRGTFDVEHGLIRWSSNYTFLISLALAENNLMAVYKPQGGERPLWDFPDGTLCFRERAAYLTSAALGWDIVPPTVLREGPHGLGSVQYFIEHDPQYHYFEFDDSMIPQLMRLALFDYLINNADRKGGHCIADCRGRLWGIDHGISFHTAHKLRTVIWDFAGQPAPEHLLKDVEAFQQTLIDPDSAYHQEMTDLISTAEFESLARRTRRVLEKRTYPLPGPGPNQPWPPV
ncbi:MAG: SCO1664 family protein [Phototrophicaceae bacterium]